MGLCVLHNPGSVYADTLLPPHAWVRNVWGHRHASFVDSENRQGGRTYRGLGLVKRLAALVSLRVGRVAVDTQARWLGLAGLR